MWDDSGFAYGLFAGVFIMGFVLVLVLLHTIGYETKQECTTADSVTICRDVKYGEWYVKEGK